MHEKQRNQQREEGARYDTLVLVRGPWSVEERSTSRIECHRLTQNETYHLRITFWLRLYGISFGEKEG